MLKPVRQDSTTEYYEFYFADSLVGSLEIHWTGVPSIWDVKIREKYRGIGLGTQMMEECLEILKQDAGGYSKACLYVHLDNFPAIKVYEKVGFRHTGEFRTVRKDAEKMEILL